jgi:hypothetical protein
MKYVVIDSGVVPAVVVFSTDDRKEAHACAAKYEQGNPTAIVVVMAGEVAQTGKPSPSRDGDK